MQQQLQLEQERSQRESFDWGGGQKIQTPPQEQSVEKDGVCHHIKHIEIVGSQEVSLQPLLSSYENRCLYAVDIENILGLITTRYVTSGYITTRAYLQNQDLRNGTLLIRVVEGKLEGFKLNGSPTASDYFNLHTAFPFLVGKILNLRDLEQGIDQINSLPSNKASMDIVPGEEEGASTVIIRNNPTSPLRLGVSYDNTGQRATGQDQFGVSAGLDDLLGLGDGIRASYQSSNPKLYQTAYSNMASINYFLPIGYNTVTLGYLATTYRQYQSLTTGLGYLSNGFANNLYGQLSRVIYRNQLWKLNVSTTLTQKHAGNYFADQPLPASSPSLAIWDMDAFAMRIMPGVGSFSFGFGTSQGTRLLNATVNSADEGAPQAQYRKTRESLLLNLIYPIKESALIWSNQTSAQQTRNVLYGSEEMMVVGPSAVRGFVANFMSGNNAFVSRNDVGIQIPFRYGGVTSNVKPYIGMDFGSALPVNLPSGRSGAVSGGTLGVSFGVAGWTADISYSKPLRILPWMLPESGVAYIRLRYDLDFNKS